ncbi:MAG: murein DD-endopeptidase MepM/ murein hydrolase activator NlpD [Porticoccus sp.]|jgi:murein DD-endopeptidase MepM/ murein hydrolase activator NlpD|uniref:peptidoglycan DD-metalloendopeptidase family protein n=1 Tax=Porticoccus sp. TaxID=2024853 RepID=UPI0039E5C990|tara:strand:+ start:2278 stop:3717 length:1440 start_codon:yes stop_codon:yes gene_type:complete
MSQARFTSSTKNETIGRQLLAAKHSRHHLVILGSLAAAIFIGLSVLPSEEVEANRQAAAIDLTFQESTNRLSHEPAATLTDANRETTPAKDSPENSSDPADALTWSTATVRSGSNLSTMFQQVSLSARDVYRLMSSSPLTKPLTRMRPGEELLFGLNESGSLGQLIYNKSRLESYVFTEQRETDGPAFSAEHVVRQPEVINSYRESTIDDSLFLAGERADLPHNTIMEIANIFGWDVDFALDIRKGDKFSVLYEEKYLDGEKIGTGNILVAEFTNQGKSFQAVRYEDSKGVASYYTPDGMSMRKAFLRAPLDFTRISSNFNLRRMHPIHKSIRAHRGVDYAAPRGTPIFASGEGKVIASAYSKANGNYVFIQHGQGYTTKYLHLDKRTVKRGQHVKQRQVIGTLGSTGYATGPHLHYEFLVNGVHRNPRTVSLPEAQPIDPAEKSRFVSATKTLMTRLAKNRQSFRVALLTEKNPSQAD